MRAPTQAGLEEGEQTATRLRGRMIASRGTDWQCYHLYGLLVEDGHHDGDDPRNPPWPACVRDRHGWRMAKGNSSPLVERHGSTPVTQVPGRWPDAYRHRVEQRIRLIETNKTLSIERPEYKRRWNDESWQHWNSVPCGMADRLESTEYRKSTKGDWSALQSTAELADTASGDHEFLEVASLFRGRPDFDVAALVNEMIEGESVPFLPVLRYKPSGLRKREVWERTWDLQRKEDAGEDVGDIPVPPKYTSADFLKQDYWRLRGKLDVPKDRTSYPTSRPRATPARSPGPDNRLQQATALVAYYDARKREGWDAGRLTPVLAGLDQLLPWVHQWHPEIDPEFGDTAGQSYQALLENDAQELGLTLDHIRNWQPPQATTRRRART
ncbi:MAG: hypothetical protein WKF75_01180 [Singulisphaera sp.]